MRQFAADDHAAASAKDNLWQQDEEGNWRIDPERDALRMANHTRVYHTRPSKQVLLDAVTKQFHSGEGAIQFAPEAIARSNADLLTTPELRQEFIDLYCDQGRDEAGRWLSLNHGPIEADELEHRLSRYGLNPAVKFWARISTTAIWLRCTSTRSIPAMRKGNMMRSRAGALSVACLLNHKFEVERYRQSRAWDPIVGVSFTGLFDFFVHAFGTPWLTWWEAGRPDTEEGREFKRQEADYLKRWKAVVNETVWDYCDRHGACRLNPLHHGAACRHQESADRCSSRMASPPRHNASFVALPSRKNDPVAMACMDYGYTVVPSQSDKDDQGRLLDDPFDPRCTEWLVEIPTEVSWANLPGADAVDINAFSAMAQFDFYMQVQTHYTAHNTSATIEFRENEIEPLAEALHQTIENGDGYISAALLARFDANATFPRLPFELIDAETYERMQADVVARRVNTNFFDALQRYDGGELTEAGPAGCDSTNAFFLWPNQRIKRGHPLNGLDPLNGSAHRRGGRVVDGSGLENH